MKLLNSKNALNGFLFAGLVVLVIANVLRMVDIHLRTGLPENLPDGGMGLCYGLALGLMITGFRRRASAQSCRKGGDN